ncbi:MAG: cobalt-precorrin-8X methylmutase [Prochloraceae cyanobacterium]
MSELNHPILKQSFALIDRQIGEHNLNAAEYAIARRVIHSTADFEFINLLKFSPEAIESGIKSLQEKVAIVTDVTMVKQGIKNQVDRTFKNPILSAVEAASSPLPGKTRTETGLLKCFQNYPDSIYVFGNAPTALLALCSALSNSPIKPKLIIGAPVGFVSVVESKQALAEISIPQIRVEGNKGGSTVAAAIINALLVMAWEKKGVG